MDIGCCCLIFFLIYIQFLHLSIECLPGGLHAEAPANPHNQGAQKYMS